jgi:hypothetical protein
MSTPRGQGTWIATSSTDRPVPCGAASVKAVAARCGVTGKAPFCEIGFADAMSAAFGIAAAPVDVSGVPPWPSLLGRTVLGLQYAWHGAGSDSDDSLWAIRINLDSAESVVIALGVVEDGHLIYLPDSIVVIFEPDVARSYSIPAADGSSWGGEA